MINGLPRNRCKRGIPAGGGQRTSENKEKGL